MYPLKHPAAALRHVLGERSATVVPGVFDGLSASLTRAVGFQAAYMSGSAVAATAGLPDIGLTTQTEMADRVALISRTVEIPLIADADTGFGDVTNTVRTVQLYEQAGAAAVQLEDQQFPKRCGHLDGKQVIAAEEFARKIEAVAQARRDPATVIIARTDARASLGFDEAIRRANLYAEAGADMVFVEAPETMSEVMAVPAAVPVPAMFNLVDVPGSRTPRAELAQLREAGYSVVILPGLTFVSGAVAMRTALVRAARGEVAQGSEISVQELFETVGLRFWEDLRNRYGYTTNDSREGAVNA
ncbi:isocitrate lyase/PEP mutase family protein [Nocardia aurantiaca]|uniref:Carboxyvinyl-carboxyphosphonate phosphorylmutase n=1 Tax=Nocardia aurantiaca TaxID=2675850 RepID=A0A6I3L9A1_9NOCA|nr:isocitrate lyase/PEP mutase family protein [Nocardia aurantiaca]MTE16816.1 carboxyvinyl-carboxyphosphonate phosphorylmutase [Nocardia aurantiaca]